MDRSSLNETAFLINQKKIHESLLKAEALLQMALNMDLNSQAAHDLYGFLWVLSDLISDARARYDR